MFESLTSSLSRIGGMAATTDKSDGVPEGEHWVTTKEGHHILIRDKDGEVVSGGKVSDAIRSAAAAENGRERRSVEDVVRALGSKGLSSGVSTDREEFKRLLEEHRKATGAEKTVDALGFYNPRDGKIYLDEDRLTTRTAIHEFSHPFLDKLRDSKTPEERAFWERGIQLVKEMGLDTPDGEDAYKGLNDEDRANEVLADRMAAHGEALVNDAEPDGGDGIGGRLYEYGRDFFRRLGKAFGVGNIDPDDLSRMTLDEWIEAASAHMFGMEAESVASPKLTGSEHYLGTDERGRLKFNVRTWEETKTLPDGRTIASGRDVLKSALEDEVKGGRLSRKDADAILDETEAMYSVMKDFYSQTDENGNPRYAAFSKWCDAEVLLDSEGRPYYGVKVPNGDYQFNFDFSTVCKKRRPLDAIFAALIDRGVMKADENGFVNLDPVTIAKMQKVISEHGLEVACAICFVDSKRYTIASDTYKFVAGWNGLVDKCRNDPKWWKDRMSGIEEKVATGKNKNFIERMATLINYAHMAKSNPDEFRRLVAQARAVPPGKRKEPDQHILMVAENPDIVKPIDAGHLLDGAHLKEFARKNAPIYDLVKKNGGAHKAKDSFLDNPWYSDILRPFDHMTNAKGAADIDRKKAYSVGGVRLQSFSDFVPSMTFDYMQMMAEMSAKRLPMHVYTKEPSFVKIFGRTGAKINMSLVPKGDGLQHNADGSVKMTTAKVNGKDVKVPVYDISNETFPEEDAYRLREGNPDVGTIMVGATDAHIMAALDDPRIDMVIPYHKSGINPGVAQVRGIQEHEDYSKFQHTIGTKGKGLKNDGFDFYGKLDDLKDPRKVADAYLEHCRKMGFTPKFAQFSKHRNYYKLLADFRLYKDNGTSYAPQTDVKVTKDTYKGVLPHIREALEANEDAQSKLSAALGTKDNPGPLFTALRSAFFTGREAEERKERELSTAARKWTQKEMIESRNDDDDDGGSGGKARKGSGQDAGDASGGMDSLNRALSRIGRL